MTSGLPMRCYWVLKYMAQRSKSIMTQCVPVNFEFICSSPMNYCWFSHRDVWVFDYVPRAFFTKLLITALCPDTNTKYSNCITFNLNKTYRTETWQRWIQLPWIPAGASHMRNRAFESSYLRTLLTIRISIVEEKVFWQQCFQPGVSSIEHCLKGKLIDKFRSWRTRISTHAYKLPSQPNNMNCNLFFFEQIQKSL